MGKRRPGSCLAIGLAAFVLASGRRSGDAWGERRLVNRSLSAGRAHETSDRPRRALVNRDLALTMCSGMSPALDRLRELERVASKLNATVVG